MPKSLKMQEIEKFIWMEDDHAMEWLLQVVDQMRDDAGSGEESPGSPPKGLLEK